MRKLAVLFAMVSMILSVTAVAHAGVFPFVEQYNANYNVTQGTNNWTSMIQFTGTVTEQNKQWLVMQWTNWNGDGSNPSQDVRVTGAKATSPDTANTLYYYDPTQPSASDPYSIPLFVEGAVNSTWQYTDTGGHLVTAKITSIGKLTVPAGTYHNVYEVLYTDAGASNVNKTMWWQPGVGLIQETDNHPATPITWELASNPFADILAGNWTGNMDIVSPGSNTVEYGTVQVSFNLLNITQAYNGTLTWTPADGSAGSDININISVIRGPFDPTLLHITAENFVILGEMRKVGSNYVVDLHGSDVSTGNTFVSLGMTKE